MSCFFLSFFFSRLQGSHEIAVRQQKVIIWESFLFLKKYWYSGIDCSEDKWGDRRFFVSFSMNFPSQHNSDPFLPQKIKSDFFTLKCWKKIKPMPVEVNFWGGRRMESWCDVINKEIWGKRSDNWIFTWEQNENLAEQGGETQKTPSATSTWI